MIKYMMSLDEFRAINEEGGRWGTVQPNEVPNKENMTALLQKLFHSNIEKIDYPSATSLVVTLTGKFQGYTINIDMGESMASNDSGGKAESIYTAAARISKNGKPLISKPTSLSGLLKSLLNYSTNLKKAEDGIQIDSNAQFKSPAESITATGRKLTPTA